MSPNNLSSAKTVSKKKWPGGPRSVQVSMNLVGPNRNIIEAPNSPALLGESLLDSHESFDELAAAAGSMEMDEDDKFSSA